MWARSYQRVADRVSSSLSGANRTLSWDAFCYIARQITWAKSKEAVYKLFRALHGDLSLSDVAPLVTALKEDHISIVQSECNWEKAKAWAAWWTRPKHLKMLCKPFTDIEGSDWDRAPKDTNAVEGMNRLSKIPGSIPPLYTAMEVLYKKDKALTLQYIAAANKCKTSYRSSLEQERRESAQCKKGKRKRGADKSASFGPPDKACNFDQDPDSDLEIPALKRTRKGKNGKGVGGTHQCTSKSARKQKDTNKDAPATTKRQCKDSDSSAAIFPMNRDVDVLYDDGIWYRGKVSSFNVNTGKWKMVFYDDGETTEVAFPDNRSSHC